MRTLKLTEETRKNVLEELLKRSPNNYGEYEKIVSDIVNDVVENGDKAVFSYTSKFDKWDVNAQNVRVSVEEIQNAYTQVDAKLVEVIKGKKANLQILDMKVDTSTPQGEFFLTILAAIAQLERQTIRERTLEGVAIAKAAGKYKGRKKGSIELRGKPLEEFVYLYNLGMNKSRLAERYGVPRSTIYRWIDTLVARKKIKKKETTRKKSS